MILRSLFASTALLIRRRARRDFALVLVWTALIAFVALLAAALVASGRTEVARPILDRVVTSIRWELMREGVEDYESRALGEHGTRAILLDDVSGQIRGPIHEQWLTAQNAKMR